MAMLSPVAAFVKDILYRIFSALTRESAENLHFCGSALFV
jgi:hypothetical protein